MDLTIEPGIRNAVRALIMRDGKLLLLRKEGPPLGLRYALPGGGQDLGETLEDALQRECMEEINTRVEMIRLLNVADFFKQRHVEPPSLRQHLEILFECGVPEDYQPMNGPHPDKQQVAVEWVPINQLSETPFLPAELGTLLQQATRSPTPGYLGKLVP